MKTKYPTSLVRGCPVASLAALLCLAANVAGCTNLLDVKNPNNVNESDLSNPKSAFAQANGVLASLARAWGIVLTPYSVATDELTWIGSRDAWQSLDQGTISEPTNEFVDAAFPYVGEARWFSDATIKRLTDFAARAVLPDTNDLARTYLYGALTYTIIGDFFNDFPLASDKTVAAPPVGAANMGQVYDTAVAYTTRGIALAQAMKNIELELALTAASARARHAKAVWALFPHPAGPGGPPANPLVNDAAAVADATVALALADRVKSFNWKYKFDYSQETVTTVIGFEVNERMEMSFGSRYAAVNPDSKTVDSLTIKDPISGIVDPDFAASANNFLNNPRYGSLTALSAREMHLIIAEAALAAGDTPGFATAINRLRALDGLAPY